MRFCVKSMFGRIDANDFDALSAFFHPAAIYRRPGYPALDGFQHILDFYRRDRIIGEGRHSVLQIARAGDVEFVAGSFEGKRRDGSPIATTEFTDCYVLRDEKVIERTTYFFSPAI